jgi:hypothetical protein
MAWKDAFGLHQREFIHDCQPSQDAAVEDRHVLRHDQVAGEQAAGLLVQDGEITVRVRSPPSL